MGRKPTGMIEPYAQLLDPERIARLLYDRHRGKARRIKLKDLGIVMFGEIIKRDGAAGVALRNTVSGMIDHGVPIGSEPGPDGGYYWIATETERREVVALLRSQIYTVQRRCEAILGASLEYRAPRGQAGLPFNTMNCRSMEVYRLE